MPVTKLGDYYNTAHYCFYDCPDCDIKFSVKNDRLLDLKIKLHKKIKHNKKDLSKICKIELKKDMKNKLKRK